MNNKKISIDRIETVLARAGIVADEITGAMSAPIYQTSTFRHPSLGESTGYDYTRTSNPTRKVLENVIAELEKGDAGFAFASGLAAVTAVLMMFRQGDRLIVSDDLYGGTYRLFEQVFSRFGVSADYANTSDIREVEKAFVKGTTKGIFVETPTNPMMKITDIRRAAEFAKAENCLTIVDNTFMTPYLQRPIEFGADIVVHSGTKFLSGHNDTLSGLVVTATKELSEKVGFIQNASGGVLSPMDSWLTLRGMKTLAVRMDRSQENARAIAEWLKGQKNVLQTYYPHPDCHEGSEVHAKQSEGCGSMISFRVKDENTAERVINNVKVISFAESLGGVESLITYPVRQTHADIPEAIRERIGVTKDLLRLSVGIENVKDLIADLEQAFGN